MIVTIVLGHGMRGLVDYLRDQVSLGRGDELGGIGFARRVTGFDIANLGLEEARDGCDAPTLARRAAAAMISLCALRPDLRHTLAHIIISPNPESALDRGVERTRADLAHTRDRLLGALALGSQPRIEVHHDDGHSEWVDRTRFPAGTIEHLHLAVPLVDVETGNLIELGLFKRKAMAAARQAEIDLGLPLTQRHRRDAPVTERNGKVEPAGNPEPRPGRLEGLRRAAGRGPGRRTWPSWEAFEGFLAAHGFHLQVLDPGSGASRGGRLVSREDPGESHGLSRLGDRFRLKRLEILFDETWDEYQGRRRRLARRQEREQAYLARLNAQSGIAGRGDWLPDDRFAKLRLLRRFCGEAADRSLAAHVHWIDLGTRSGARPPHAVVDLRDPATGRRITRLRDTGDQITAEGTITDPAVHIMVLRAQRNGWTSVDLLGSDEDFRRRAHAALTAAGIVVGNYAPEQAERHGAKPHAAQPPRPPPPLLPKARGRGM